MFPIKATLLIYCVLNVVCAKSKWVDPHDISYDQADHESSACQDTFVALRTGSNDNNSDFPRYYKRLINVILFAIKADAESDTMMEGHFRVDLPMDDYRFLKEFAGASSADPSKLRQIDSIISAAFRQPLRDRMEEVVISFADLFYITFYNRSTMIFMFCALCAYTIYKLVRINFSLGYVIKIVLVLAFVVDFWFTWLDLLQVAEIDRLAASLQHDLTRVPRECRPDQMSLLEYFFYYNSFAQRCKEYHHVKLRDRFYSIGPMTVISHQFGVIVATPAQNLGKAFSSFVSGSLSELPWFVNYLLLPVILIFAIAIFGIVLSFVTGTDISFNLLHLIHLKLNNKQSATRHSTTDGRSRRAYIEDVPYVRLSAENQPPVQSISSDQPSNSPVADNLETNEPSNPSIIADSVETNSKTTNEMSIQTSAGKNRKKSKPVSIASTNTN